MSKVTLAGIILAGVIIAIIMPLLIIWALNTLFPALSIPYNLSTWFATLVLVTLPKTKMSKIKKPKTKEKQNVR